MLEILLGVQALCLCCDRILSPQEKEKVVGFLEGFWYQSEVEQNFPMYRRVAFDVNQQLSYYCSNKYFNQFWLVFSCVALTSYVFSLYVEYCSIAKKWKLILNEYESLPPILLVFIFLLFSTLSLSFLFLLIKLTAACLKISSRFNWFIALIIPFFSIIVSFCLIITLVFLLDNVPTIVDSSIVNKLVLFSYIVIVPISIFYVAYVILIFSTFVNFIVTKVFSRVALVNSHHEEGKYPFTTFGFFMNLVIGCLNLLDKVFNAM